LGQLAPQFFFFFFFFFNAHYAFACADIGVASGSFTSQVGGGGASNTFTFTPL